MEVRNASTDLLEDPKFMVVEAARSEETSRRLSVM